MENKRGGFTAVVVILFVAFLFGVIVTVNVLSNEKYEKQEEVCMDVCDDLGYEYHGVRSKLGILMKSAKSFIFGSNSGKDCWCSDDGEVVKVPMEVEE